MADRCLNADILATTLLGNNEGFAKQIVGLAQEKNAISNIAWDSARTKQLTKQIDMQIQSMIEARILFWNAWDVAKQQLIKKIRNKWWTLWAWARLLDMIDNLSVENVEEYAWLVWKDRTDVAWVKQAITDLKFAVSDFIAAKNNLKVNYWTKFYNKLLPRKERIKAIWDWWRADLKAVREWKAPTELVNPDEQWKHIVSMTWWDLAERERLFNNRILWRTFLWEDDSAFKDVVFVIKKFDNTLPSITVDEIKSFTSVNELINRVYSNTLDIAHNRELRFALKAKLIELIHQWDIPLTLVEDSIRLTNTTLFADAWDSFTSILKYDNTAKAVRNTLIDETGKSRVSPDLDSKSIFNELKKILERPWLKKDLLWKDWKKEIQGFWTKLDWEELLKIIYAMSWDNEVKQVIEMHYAISDTLIIDFAKAKLFWIDVKKADKNLTDIIEKFSKPYSPDEVSTMAFVATSWVPVKPTDNSKIAFVHFAEENLTLEDEKLMSRAAFNDELAWVNTLTVTNTNIPTFDITYWVAHVPSDLEYVVIPNANIANSYRIKELKSKLEKYWKNNKYIIVYPRSRQSGQYFVDVDWKLKFKTTNTNLFNEMSNSLAINSFNNATIDLTENTVSNRELIQASNEKKLEMLNNKAVEFFKNYMWTAAAWLDDKQIIQKVTDMTGIPLNPNEANLAWDWELAQRVMFNNYTASWRYVKDITTKDNINIIEGNIRWMSDEDVLKEIIKMWHTINKPTALNNIEAIREALINMKTTDNLVDYIWNKWVIIGLWNMNDVSNITIENFKSILASDNPLESLADLFFWWRSVSKSELESMNTYLSDIMDSLISEFSHKLLVDWYQMPLLSPRKAFMDYLKWNVSISDEFIQAFAFKNWLEEDYNLVKKIFDDHMPSEINVNRIINKDTLVSVRRENKWWLVVRELSDDEKFLPTTYNSYTAVMGKIDIPNIKIKKTKTKKWKTKKELWNPSLTEDEVIRNILTKYENAVEQHIKNKTMTTKVAQDLKQQASYALNIATQDLILSRYGSLLSSSDREWLLWMWYNLKLASNTRELNALKQANAQTMWRFKERRWELAKQNNILFSNTSELNKKLLESWKVFTERDWQQAVVDVWDELENSIKSIPDTAWEFTSLKQLTKGTIKELSPKQAYVMLKTIDLVKNNITRGNFYTQLMYQLNPQLRKAVNWLDFFQSFKTVDVWGWVWVPWSLTSNATNWYVEAGKQVLDEADIAYKAWITKAIYEWYIRNWKELTLDDLKWIVNKEIWWTTDKDYAQHYIDAFTPYTSLKWLSENVKTYINQLLNQESSEVQALLKEAWADLDWLMDTTVVLDDWSTVAIKDIINWNVDWWKQRMFWWLSDNWDELYANKQSQRNIQEEMNWAYAWFNDVALVSDNQSKAITQILWNARKILQRDTHTQKFVEFDNAIWWQNDILKWLMQFHIFSWWKRWLSQEDIAKQSRTWAKIKHWLISRKGMFSEDVWSDVQKIYEVYYSKTLKELNWIATPNDWVHQVALEMAKYFKQLEQRLGSKNWATWVSVIPRVNIAFWNLWNIVRNVHSEDWVWSLMNKIGNNQVIWLFKFTKEWESAYNEFLKNLATNKQSEKWLSNALNWRSVELIEWNKKEIQQKFNEMFGSNFSESDINVIVQWLWWYQIVNSQWWKVFNKINSYIARAWRTTRMLMTYPFQLFTIHPQLFAYNVKSSTEKRMLWVENLSLTKDIRKKYWVLEWTYVELNPRGWVWENVRKLKEIMSRDSDELADVWLELDDWILWLYWKTTTYTDKKYTVPQQLALFDSLRDNANNIIDASQAQTFKWIAFLKALQKNDYLTFMNAEAFDAFMNRSDISQAVKDKLLDKVNIYSNRIFNDLLGTWFTWLDKAYWWWKVSDFFIWLLSTINFKGAWWTNIFRQTFEKLWTVLKVWWERFAKWNKEAADEMWRYVISTPEFTNLTECLWWDMIWMWKMWKYGKNWYIPDDESEVEMMDYISWIFDNIELVSQQWQWLISFWWMRPFTSAVNAVYWTRDKWWESMWYWAWAFVNSLVQNFWRWWKPWSLWVDAIMVAERDWIWAWWDYLRENFYTLSAWTMRYMIEEWYNAYWANTALTNQRWWIPAFMIGNQYEGSDTAFSYKVRQYQTWDYLKNFFDKDEWSYARWELLSSAINSSQFFKIWTNAVKSAVWLWALLLWAQIPDWARSKKWVYSILDIQEDFEQSPTFIQFMETGKAMPPDQKKTNKLIELYTNANYPGWYKAYDWIQNFKNTGHINWNKDKWNYYDQWLEEFYARIEQANPWELERFMKYYNTAFLWDPNSEEGRVFAYNWAVNWLNNFTWDSQYNVYASALYKGNLNNYYYEMLDAEARRLTEVRKALWFSKEQAKVSRTDINNLDDVKDAINRRFLNEHYDDMYKSDAELMQNQIYQWIADELEPDVANWYFTQQPETNYAGNETGEMEWVISNNIKWQIKDLIFVEKAIADWRWEDALTRWAILTQSLNYNDEMWLIRASAVDYYAYRIVNSDWPDTVKQSALAWLIDNNEEVFKYNSELAEKYWEYYDAANEYKNEVLYNVTLDDINLLNAMAISLHQQWEDTKWWASSWVKVTAKLNNLRWALESSPSWWKWYSSSGGNVKWAAIPIKWLSAMWYKPATVNKNIKFETVYKSQGYDPKTKTLWPITPPKKNKAVKWKSTRKMTQKEENELDLL